MTTRAAMVEAVRRALVDYTLEAVAHLTLDRAKWPPECRAHEAALTAAAEALAAEAWRPIAECPEEWKDGRAVDLWGIKSNDATMRPAAQSARRFTNCRWRRAVDVQGDFPVGWYEGDDRNHIRPSHVRPLPPPPEAG